MQKKLPAILAYLISLVVIIVLWSMLARIVNAELILPGPGKVIIVLFQVIQTKIFWQCFAGTFVRVIVSFLITVLLGGFIGLLCGISDFAKDFFEIPLAVIRATPVIAFILVAYFWFTSGFVPVFVAVLMSLPIMVTAITTGFKSSDKKYLAMAQTYNLSKKEIIRYIKIPQNIPYFCNGALSCFGLCWKVVAAGEVICLPKKAVGTLLQRSQVHLETSEVIAQTIVLVIVSFVIERLFAVLIGRRVKKYE